MLSCVLRRSGLPLLGRRLGAPLSDGAAAPFTSTAADGKADKKRDPADDFIFKVTAAGATCLACLRCYAGDVPTCRLQVC